MNRNQNHDDDDDASSTRTKRVKTSDNGGVSPWSNLHHDVLFLIMMQLRVFDFFSFSKVCKTWRSFALSNKNIFMESRPPLWIVISLEDDKREDNKKEKNYCCMRDFENRRYETNIPLPSRVTVFGFTCGYLMLLKNARRDFWLVNPITRHELHFPACRLYGDDYPDKGILVFSPSISRWVFLILFVSTSKIWFYIEGKRGWNHVSSTLPIFDLHAFNGKIYTLHTGCCLFELRLIPNPKFTFLITKNFPELDMETPEFVNSVENLCIIDRSWEALNKQVLKLDFGEMKWVSLEKTTGEYAFFVSNYYDSSVAAIKPELWESWADPEALSKINKYLNLDNYLKSYDPRPSRFCYASTWYMIV